MGTDKRIGWGMSAPILPTSNRIQALRVQEFLREGGSESEAVPQQSSSPLSQGFNSAPSVSSVGQGSPGAPGAPGADGLRGEDGLGVDALLLCLSSDFNLVLERNNDVLSLPPGVALIGRAPVGRFLQTRDGQFIKRG